MWGSGLAGNKPAVVGSSGPTVDATSGKMVPASDAEWAAVRAAAGVAAGSVRSIWQMQEISGNLADSVGGKTLTAFSTPLYSQTISGWSRKAIRLDGTGDAFYSLDSGIGNTATTSHLVFALVALAGSQASDLPTINVGLGAANADRRQLFVDNPTNALSVRGDGGQASATGTVDMTTTVHPVWFMINRAGAVLAAVSDNEVVQQTLTLPSSGTNAYLSFEGTNNSYILYAALFDGAAAELSVNDLIAMNVAMGWTIPWAKDATSNKFLPATAAQFTTLGLVAPDEIWMGNLASGNMVGLISGGTLTAANSPLYQQVVTGWSTTGVRGNASTGNQRFEGTGPDPSTADVVSLLYVGNITADATVRPLFACGTSPSDLGLAIYDDTGARRIRGRSAGGVSDSVGTYTTGGHAVLFGHDTTNTREIFVTDVEARAKAYAAATSGTAYGLGAIGGGTFSTTTIMYLARFTGASARALSTSALAKPFLQRLGWTIPW